MDVTVEFLWFEVFGTVLEIPFNVTNNPISFQEILILFQLHSKNFEK